MHSHSFAQPLYNCAMPHPKSIRRLILFLLYEAYRRDPLQMLGPEAFLERGLSREELAFNIHYLTDSLLVELMRGYNPPLFSAARITAAGIDVVEDEYEFNRRFPAAPEGPEAAFGALPQLIERLLAEAELTHLDPAPRQALLGDINILRTEVARPASEWRTQVLLDVLQWIRLATPREEPLQALEEIEVLVRKRL